MFAFKPCGPAMLAALLGPMVVGSAQAEPIVHDGLSEPAAAWSKAMEAGDLAALERMHAPEAEAFPPDKFEVKGGKAILADYADLFAKYTVKVKDDEAHWIEEGPLIVSWGVSTLTLHPKAGGPDIVSRSRYTDASVKRDGQWRYIVDQASKPTK